ncbi:hypothetical protein ANMWB30_23180 [Arthrobacter sp. MWB30]|nr:hypothetical protein ANMWB30_23180 [Arthrobacter sp. MWB30]
MAQLKGEGSMTGVNLIVVTYDNNATKDGKTQYLDAQINAQDARGPEQTNLHLVTNRSEADGKTRFSNGAPYSTKQFEAIKEAAGDNYVRLDSGAHVYAVKANVMPASRGNGLVINTKSLASSDFGIDEHVIEAQRDSSKAAKEAREAAVEAGAPEAQAEGPEVEAAEATVDEPAMA